MGKHQYLGKVAQMLGVEQLAPPVRRRALWFYLCGWMPQGAAVQLRMEQEAE